ncbi:MAG: membrane protein insertion efficiency factor YidD [Planctomycetales bacterium 4484_113]|nr:MAG: membrane protein insertion efficiency factor YidD [Planctomycetales bacterium 4484_113]
MSRLLVFLIHLYQREVSPLLPPSCRYHPTCSHYAIEAIQKHGALRGSILAMWRILRCNPFSKGGFDPVPEPKSRDRSVRDHESCPHHTS